jgi:hypothetical protein
MFWAEIVGHYGRLLSPCCRSSPSRWLPYNYRELFSIKQTCVALQNMYPLHHRSINKRRVVNTEIENWKHEAHKEEQASNNNNNGGAGRWQIKPRSERKGGEMAAEQKLRAKRNTNYFMYQTVVCQAHSFNAMPAFLLFSWNKWDTETARAHSSGLLPYLPAFQ